MSYNYSITSVSSARAAYRKMKDEPAFYKGKMQRMLNAEHLNLDFSKTKTYTRELETLKNSASSCASKMDSVINKLSGKGDKSDREDAKILKNNFLQISKEFKTIAKNIENTESDFKAFDKRMLTEADKLISGARLGTAKLSLSKLGTDKADSLSKLSAGSPASKSVDYFQNLNDNPQTRYINVSVETSDDSNRAKIEATNNADNLSEVQNGKLQYDVLEKVLLAGGINIDSLTSQEKKALLGYFEIKEHGAVVTGLNGVNIQDVLVSIRNGETKEQRDHLFYTPVVFWYEEGKLKSKAPGGWINGKDLNEILKAVQLYNISQLSVEQYEKQGNTFEYYGLIWFNEENMKRILNKSPSDITDSDYEAWLSMYKVALDELNKGNPEMYERMTELSYDNPISTVFPSFSTDINAKGDVYTLNESFIHLAARYSCELDAALLGINNLKDLRDNLDKESLDKLENAMSLKGLLEATIFNGYRIIDQKGLGKKTYYKRNTVADFLNNDSMISVTTFNPESSTVKQSYELKHHKEFLYDVEYFLDDYSIPAFRVYPPSTNIASKISEDAQRMLELNKKDYMEELSKYTGNFVFEEAKERIGGKLLENVLGDTLEIFGKTMDIPITALEFLKGSAETINDVAVHNDEMQKIANRLMLQGYAEAFMITGQYNGNALDSVSIPTMFVDVKKLEYALYMYNTDDKTKNSLTIDKIVSSLEASETLEIPNDSGVKEYASWFSEKESSINEGWALMEDLAKMKGVNIDSLTNAQIIELHEQVKTARG